MRPAARATARRAALAGALAAQATWAGALAAQGAGGAAPRAAGEPAAADEVVVRSAPSRRAPTEIVLGGADAARGAGTQGDPAKALQSLPGFGRGGPGEGELIAWGGAPGETRVFVDGVEVPALYHGDGVRSIVPAGLVRDLRAAPGAYGPEYGRALGGVVRLTTEGPSVDRPHLRVGADALDGRAYASAPLGRGVAVAASGRYGWVDRLLPALGADEAGELLVVPRYADWQAQAAARLRAGEGLRATLLSSRDEFRRSVGGDDPSARRGDRRRSSFDRVFVRYERSLPDGASVALTPFVGRDERSLEASFGFGPPSRLALRSLRYGARAEYAAPLGAQAKLALGLDASGAATRVERAGSPSRPPREGDPYAFGEPPGDAYDVDAYRTSQLGVAPYAALDLALGRLRLAPALRVDAYLLEVERLRPEVGRAPPVGDSSLVAAAEPRLALRYAVAGPLEAFAAGGRYHQPPAPEDLGATFGNPRLGLASATQLAAGERLALGDFQLEALGFVKWIDGLAARPPAASPEVARLLEPGGRGRAYGASWLLRRRPAGEWFGWLSATLSRSERTNAPGLAARLSDHDRPVVVAASLGRELGPWTLSARARYASGAPRTPVVGAFVDLRSGRHQPVFGAPNSVRLPPFAQLDLRVDRAFSLGAGAALRLYLDVINVTARANAEEIVYARDFRAKAYFSGLPTLAVFGAELEQ
ncbi:MAG TPA: TonB-dependent receptor [Polyangiaceae bacterium]|nr:TonB-dependent receptor [Polyangiaceae bacterium]